MTPSSEIHIGHTVFSNPWKDRSMKAQLRKFSVAATITAIIAANILPSDIVRNYLMTPVVLSCLFLFGLPHGAIDHVLFYQLYNELRHPEHAVASSLSPDVVYGDVKGCEKTTSLNNKLRISLFYFNYFTIMLIWSIAWIECPLIAFWAFLAVSAYHFGEGDMNHLADKMLLPPFIMNFSRGILLIGSLVSSQPDVTLPIIASVARIQDPSVLFPHTKAIQVLTIFQNISLLSIHIIAYNAMGRKNRVDEFAIELGKSVLYAVLFHSMDPLLAFSIYFGLWHSVGSVFDQITFLKSRNSILFRDPDKVADIRENHQKQNITLHDIFVYYKCASLYTIVAIFGMAVLLITYQRSTMVSTQAPISAVLEQVSENTLWTVFVVSISIITGPHMWVLKLVSEFWLPEIEMMEKNGQPSSPRFPRQSMDYRDSMNPLGLEMLAKDWIVGGGWWWFPRKIQ